MDYWGSQDEHVLIEAFREGAKSTLSEEFMLIEACFRNFNYGLVIGETYTKACQRLEAIKYEALHNEKLKALFGNLKGAIWNENKALFSNGVFLEAHGWEEEFRGFKHLSHRPDRAYLDDIENRERVRDSTAVDATIRKLYMELIPAMDTAGYKVRVTQTPLADDCLVNRLKQKPDWTYARFPIVDRDPEDPEARSAWPSRYSIDWIRKKRQAYAEAGMIREFDQEYMLVAAETQGKPFTSDMLNYTDVGPRTHMPRKVIMDPARTVNVKKSDETGHVVVSRMGSRIYVWESGGDFWKPDEIISHAFDSSARHGDAQVCIEKNSLDEWLLQPIRKEMLDRGQPLDLKPILAPQEQSKVNFILGLQPFFKARDIILVGGKLKHQKLVAQIENFPAGKRDVLNALAYVLRVFSGEAVYKSFGDANIVENWAVMKSDVPALAFNQRGSEIVCALVIVSGQRTVVLQDWVSNLPIKDAVKDILIRAKMALPSGSSGRFKAYVPGDIMDQRDRIPLAGALKEHRLDVIRGSYANQVRGSLDLAMRTEWSGRRSFLVDTRANRTLSALAGDYAYQTKNGVKQGTEPEQNLAALLVEAIECLTTQLSTTDNASELPDGLARGTNARGASYLTTLR